MPLSRYQPRKKSSSRKGGLLGIKGRGGVGWGGGGKKGGGGEGPGGEGVYLVSSSQGGHESPKSVGNVGVQGPPGGHGGTGLGIPHVVCAVDRQALQVAAGLGCRGLVRGEVVGCRKRRQRELLAAC